MEVILSGLYQTITQYGDFIRLNYRFESVKYVNWTEENYSYVKYNPRKPIARYGLSLTSLDGGLSGVPDLDSLHEYNEEHFTSYEEKDFNVLTPAYKQNQDIQKFLKPFEGHFFRTHILKLDPGGFFPNHRDFRHTNLESCRLISPLKNPCTFILEDKILNWRVGHLYFLNTAKVHQLFNSTLDPSYWLVVNLEVTEKTAETILTNLLPL